jgi:hypothetical protein
LADFLVVRFGANDATVLGPAEKARLLCVDRAVSWIESRHGSDTVNSADVDPMQMANPADAWWKSLTKQATAYERFVRGPAAGNYLEL